MEQTTKWAAPVTHGASKFEVMTDELHARPVAVVNTIEDASLIAAAPSLLAAAQLVLAWFEAERDHDKASFYERIEMCDASEKAIRAAISIATGASHERKLRNVA